jgi:integrase
MSTADSTPTDPSSKSGKPAKPTSDFPLFAHAAGVWAKKIRGKLHYFGPWDDPAGALARYEEQAEALHTGRTPKPDPAVATVKDVANNFLNARQARVDAGELSPRTWDNYKRTCDDMVQHFGKTRPVDDLRPADFSGLRAALAKKLGPTALGNAVQRVRTVFKHAVEAELIGRPVNFGPDFRRPSAKTLRVYRAAQGVKLFAAEEVRRLLGAAGQPIRAMILLGINCGFGNADCGRLPQTALNLDAGILDFPRPKTGIPRRCALWPETVAALREALAARLPARDPRDDRYVFLTCRGTPWAKLDNQNPVTDETGKLLRRLDINGHRNFYTLRHTFRTVADEAKDQPAADYIMGHEVQHMSSVYRERISDERLRAVADHVRTWLFGGGAVT